MRPLVDLGYFDNDFIANRNHIFNLAYTLGRKLGNMDQTLFTRQDLDKSAEIHKAGNFTGINLANFSISNDTVDHINSFSSRLAVYCSDENLTAIVDIDFSTGFFNDFLIILPPGPITLLIFSGSTLIVVIFGAY